MSISWIPTNHWHKYKPGGVVWKCLHRRWKQRPPTAWGRKTLSLSAGNLRERWTQRAGIFGKAVARISASEESIHPVPSLGLRGRVRSSRTDSRFPSLSSQDRSPLPGLKFPPRCTLRARLPLGPQGTRPPRGGSRLSPRSWTYPACPPPSGFRGTVHHTPRHPCLGGRWTGGKEECPGGKILGEGKHRPHSHLSADRSLFFSSRAPQLFFAWIFLGCPIPGIRRQTLNRGSWGPLRLTVSLRSPPAREAPNTQTPRPQSPLRAGTRGRWGRTG